MDKQEQGQSKSTAPGGNGAQKGFARKERFSQRWRKRRSGLSLTLNLTPMIDVVFLLLFFFLAVSRFHEVEGMLPSELPRQMTGAAAADIPQTPIRIRFHDVDDGDKVCQVTIDRFQEKPVQIARLAKLLTDIKNQTPGYTATTPVHLLADDRIRFAHVVNAYNAALAAGYEQVFFPQKS
jgi:biopolymer transport protein ExbD